MYAVLNNRPIRVDNELEHILIPVDCLNFGRCFTIDAVYETKLVQGTSTKVDLVQSCRRARVILK